MMNLSLKRLFLTFLTFITVSLWGGDAHGMEWLFGKSQGPKPTVELWLNIAEQQDKQSLALVCQDNTLEVKDAVKPKLRLAALDQILESETKQKNNFFANTPQQADALKTFFEGSYTSALVLGGGNNALTEQWGTFFQSVTNLQHLVGGMNQMYQTPFLASVAENLPVTTLISLDFKGSLIDTSGSAGLDIAFLKIVNANKGLQKINLGRMGMSTSEAICFLKGVEPPVGLTHLDLTGSRLDTDEALTLVADFIKKTPALKTLKICGDGKQRSDNGMIALASAIATHPVLTDLNFNFQNDYSLNVVNILKDNPRIEKITLGGWSPYAVVPVESCTFLGQAMAKHPGIKEFWFDYLGTAEEVTKFFEGLKGNYSLKKLTLSSCVFDEPATLALADFVKTNVSVDHLSFPSMTMASAESKILVEGLLARKTPLPVFELDNWFKGEISDFIPLLTKGTQINPKI